MSTNSTSTSRGVPRPWRGSRSAFHSSGPKKLLWALGLLILLGIIGGIFVGLLLEGSIQSLFEGIEH